MAARSCPATSLNRTAAALRALARAWRWHRQLEAGRYAPIEAPARTEGMHHVHLAKLLRLTLLAPDLVEAVLDGRSPKGVRLQDLVRPLPADWAGQRRVLRVDAAARPPLDAGSAGGRP